MIWMTYLGWVAVAVMPRHGGAITEPRGGRVADPPHPPLRALCAAMMSLAVHAR